MATSPIHPMQVCNKCGEEKPFTAEYFPPNGKSFRRCCRPCWRAYERDYFWKHREAKRSAARRAREKCDKQERRRKLMAWRASNPEKVRATDLRRLERARGDLVQIARNAEKMRRWRANNPLAASAARDRRRARDVGAEGVWTREDVREILRIQGRFCFYCSARLTKFECDHFIPLARNGSNWPQNLVLSCGPCNHSKGAKMPWEWMPGRFSEGCTPR